MLKVLEKLGCECEMFRNPKPLDVFATADPGFAHAHHSSGGLQFQQSSQSSFRLLHGDMIDFNLCLFHLIWQNRISTMVTQSALTAT